MENIDDIYIPPESFWLNMLQPGWIGLALLIGAGIVALVIIIKTASSRKLRGQFIAYLADRPQLDACRTNAILKAYVSTVKQQVHITSLHGKQWRAFLLANCNMHGYMKQLDYLSGGYYKKDERNHGIVKLNEMAIYWIKNHKKKLCQS